MHRFLNLSHQLSRWLVWIGGTLILLSALMVTAEVFMRKFFNISIGGADELSGYAFGVATSFGMAYALFERAHIRVDAAFNVFPDWLKLVASFIGLALLAGFVGVICFTAWSMVADTLQHGSRSITPMRTPLAIPQIPWLAGWLFFLFSCCLVLVASVYFVLTGKTADASKLINTKSIDEQIEDESV